MHNDGRPAWTPPRVRLIFLVFLLMLVANAFDAWATIGIVAQGATELNPIMRWALKHGPVAFIAMKTCLIGSLTLFLAVASRTHRLAWRGLYVLTALYMLIFVWHVLLVIYGESLTIDIPS